MSALHRRDDRVVGMGDLGIARAPEHLVTHALGSCVGLCLRDPDTGLGGLLHAMLPHCRLDAARASKQPAAFVDSGMRWMLSELIAHGACRRRLQAILVGCAAIPGAPQVYDIGGQNLHATRSALASLQIPILAEEVGGSIARTVRFELSTGCATVFTAGQAARVLGGAP